MSDLICRKTMMRCPTHSMCTPFGGCQAGVLVQTDVRYAADAQDEPAGEDVRGRIVAAYGNGRWLREYDALVAERDQILAERDGANERAGLLLKAKDDWAERARAAEAERDQARRTAEHWKAEHLTGNAVIDQLRAEVEALRAMTAATCGVGDGSGKMFVHGDYDSIKRVQAIIFAAESRVRQIDTLFEWLANARNEVQALQKARGWISVSDELPGEQGQDSEDVLCFLNGHCSITDHKCRGGGGWGIKIGFYDAEKDMFRVAGRTDAYVTHWMPLPAAPAIAAKEGA